MKWTLQLHANRCINDQKWEMQVQAKNERSFKLKELAYLNTPWSVWFLTLISTNSQCFLTYSLRSQTSYMTNLAYTTTLFISNLCPTTISYEFEIYLYILLCINEGIEMYLTLTTVLYTFFFVNLLIF